MDPASSMDQDPTRSPPSGSGWEPRQQLDWVHEKAVAGGQTYSQVSAASLANPQDQKLAAHANTLFKGETLRGLLLYAWGWSQVGVYAFYAAIGLTIATAVSFFALVFELLVAPRPATVTKLRMIPT